MQTPLISIIIPMYKVEDYLPACLDSVIHQTYRNLEIICVNDGSPDNCAEIAQSYQQNDPRITLINKANGGLSDARNAGIDIAKGDYLFFLDSDDCIATTCIETLVDLTLNNQCQISICQYVPFQGDEVIFPDATSIECVSSTKAYLLYKQSYSRPELKITLNTAWGKLYSSKLFESVRYPFGKINEDEYLTYKLFLLADTACYTEAPLYGYRTRAGSITNSDPVSDEHKIELVGVSETRINDFKQTGDAELVSFAADDFLYQISYFYCQSTSGDFKNKLRKLYRTGYKNYRPLLTMQGKLKRTLFYLSPWLYQFLDRLAK